MNKFLLFIVLSVSQITFSQTSKNIVSGNIINSKTNESVPFVTVTLKNVNQTKSTIASDEGKFVLENLSYQKYKLTIEAIGYNTYTKAIAFTNQNYLELGNIQLEENIEALDAVVIRAETTTVTQKIDRVVINVGKDLTTAGSDASEVLNNVQSVSVDQQTGELSLRGNTNVKVLIDGKPTNIPTDQLLQQIPSSAIKNIELITNPSAKYNPEGNSGIINIELVKNTRLGINGSVSINSQYGRNFSHTGGLNINYKVKNVNWYGSYSIKDGKKNVQGRLTRFDPDYYQRIDGNDDFTNHLAKIGVDINFTEKFSLGLSTSQNFSSLDYSNNTQISETKGSPLTSDNLFAFDRKPTNQNYRLSLYQIFDDKKHTLTFDAMVSLRNKPEDSEWSNAINTSENSSNYVESLSEDRDLLLFNLDYSKPIGEGYFEVGLESRSEKTDSKNNSTQEVLNSSGAPTTSGLSSFTYKREIYSAYMNLKQQFGDFGVQAGLRAESYRIDGDFHADVDNQNDEINQTVNSLYPSFFTTYKLNDKNQIQFSYSRRVDRPSIKQVTPIRSWGTPLLTSKGNPDLKQQFTNSLEFRYNKEIPLGNLSATTFYRNIKDDISRTISVDPNVPDRGILSYSNFDDTHSYGIEFSAYLKLQEWWRINTSADVYSQNQKGIVANEYTTVKNNRFNFRINNTFKANNKLSLQLFSMYRGANKSLQRETSPMYMVNTGASYKVLKEKGTVTLSVSDIFNTFGFSFTSDKPFKQDGNFNWESRKISLRFVYNFGIKPKENSNKRKRNHEDGEADSGDGGF